MTEQPDLAQDLRALADAATPGPWEAYRTGDPAGPFGVVSEHDEYLGTSIVPQRIDRADAAFIAACRLGVPALLTENERLQGVEDRLSELLCDLTGGRLSKTGYDVRAMAQAIEAEFDRHADEGRAESRAAALSAAADAWQRGEWADAPRMADRVQERISNGQHVTEWLRARARAEEAGS